MMLGLPTWHLKSSYIVIRILVSQMRHRTSEGYKGVRLEADMGLETQGQELPPHFHIQLFRQCISFHN